MSDMHAHFRQGAVLKAVVPATAEYCGYAVAMPNTHPPITTITQVRAYLEEISAAADNNRFTPLGIAFVCEALDPDELRRGFKEKAWVAAKLYPRGGTTGSEDAASSLQAIYPLFNVMQRVGMPLLIHGEVVGPEDQEHSRWEREAIYVSSVLPLIHAHFPNLKIVLEHVSTKAGIDYVRRDMSGKIAATITPHHALLTDANVSQNGVRTDANCMPIIKGWMDRNAIQEAMTSGDERFFAGTDSAPHNTDHKYAACCSFGAFTAPGALEVYAAIFESRGIFELPDGVERFRKFISTSGPKFYGLEPPKGTITMVRNKSNEKITEYIVIPEDEATFHQVIKPLFHESLGLAPDFPWVRAHLSKVR